jgi:dTDP-4-amino-4,6-dideoxygalactose transaminase
LANSGIETKVNYPIPLHLQPAATGLGYKKGDFPITEEFSDTILSLPLYPELEDDQVFYVIKKIIQFCKN